MPALLLAVVLLAHSPDLYVSGFFASSVQRFAGPFAASPGAPRGSGTYARPVARRPWGLAFGPDGALYVANNAGSPAIARVAGPFSDAPGTVETFVDAGAYYDVAFGPDGNLYAGGNGGVRRYDVVTRELIDDFTTGRALAQVRGIAFGPDGNLYVAHFDSCVTGPNGCTGSRGEILRFDGRTGAFLDVYVPSGRGGLREPWKVAFDARGDLLVANWTLDGGNILRFPSPVRTPAARALTGAVFISRAGMRPLYVAVGPDRNVYVSDSTSDGSGGSVLRFDGTSGAFIDTYAAAVDGGPRGIAFAAGR